MNDLVVAFVLGNTSILTNVCLLPLYPGLIAFLAGHVTKSDKVKSSQSTVWLGAIVLVGVLTTMLLTGFAPAVFCIAVDCYFAVKLCFNHCPRHNDI